MPLGFRVQGQASIAGRRRTTDRGRTTLTPTNICQHGKLKLCADRHDPPKPWLVIAPSYPSSIYILHVQHHGWVGDQESISHVNNKKDMFP